jgi:hypothetical protein
VPHQLIRLMPSIMSLSAYRIGPLPRAATG